jgi:hypothetical protein
MDDDVTGQQPVTDDDARPEELEADGPKGAPDAAKAAEKYRRQRDDAQGKLKDLQTQVRELEEGNSGRLAELQRQVEEQARALEDEKATNALQKLQTMGLLAAGCVDVDVGLSLLGKDGDVDELKDAKPYLFKPVLTGSTGAAPTGAAEGGDRNMQRKEMKLPPLEG